MTLKESRHCESLFHPLKFTIMIDISANLIQNFKTVLRQVVLYAVLDVLKYR